MINIALDTSCLNVNHRNKTLNILEKLHKQNKITLKTSTVLEKEQNETNKDPEWQSKYLSKIDELEKSFEIAIIGKSVIGQCVIGDEKICSILRAIFLNKSTNSSNDFYDWWILTTALVQKCDYFITTNKRDFIENGRKEKIENLGIKVRCPDQNLIYELCDIV
ncbi:MAG: hypothetical protein JXA08_03900 [Methanomicrobiaceae archaeon]|nr:hypothetical protein [Methanomicrobiaceae archaeon]